MLYLALAMSARTNGDIGRRVAILLGLAIVVGVLTFAESRSPTAASTGWYQIGLEVGEVDGYLWGVGAKGPKHETLGEICATASVTEASDPNAPYAEGRDSAVCGRLARPKDWVAASSGFGSATASIEILTVLFRPAVRKAVLLLGSGERKIFRPRMASVPNMQARGIPRFRYMAAAFKGETCIRKVTLFDARADLIGGSIWQACPAETL